MKDRPKPHQDHTIACQICLKEVPKSEAANAEADDYVLYFCGVDCYQEWREQDGDPEG